MNANHVLANWENSRGETIDLAPEYFDRAGELSDRIADENRQWQTYLNHLAAFGFEKWLNDRNLDFAIERSSNDLELMSYLQVDRFTLGIVALENLVDGIVSIPQEAIDIPHFYIAIEIVEERQQSILRGFLRHDKFTIYKQSQNLKPDLENNYLIPFSQWETKFDRLLLNLQFIAPRAIPLPNLELSGEPSITKIVNLTQWLDNLFDSGWQAVEALWGTENIAWGFRSVSQIHREAGIKRAKLLDFGIEIGDRALALLVAITPENDEKIGIRIQLHPGENRQYLPENLSLTMLAETGETVQEVRSRSRDTYIQLRYFKTLPGTQFSVRVILGDRYLTETFVV
jgi:Protein of unknown function (DUF1822)